ncbi:MAG TPA: hypothetical protein VLU95_06040 [Candidatus Acidoferrum sp.]|nr:hypothetical protein [Candidatus Acidoferrum sp.]
MTKDNSEELEGTTLNVFLYVVKQGKPIGPRDVMKALSLSSPSVAYRHLQKLDDLGYIQKNDYGEYITKKKANVRGYFWFGRRLLPAMWRYSIVFSAILIIELFVLIIHFAHETYEFKIFFLLLLLITGLALSVFTIEGYSRKKVNKKTELNKFI